MGDPSWSKTATPAGRGHRSRPVQPGASSPPTILLSVAGLSPQVITETLYCLLVARKPPADVRAVHVITTQAGATRIREQVLAPRDGWFHRFCRDYHIPPGRIRFDARAVHVPEAEGRSLEDVRTPVENAVVADAILGLVRDLTADSGTMLHCSVAGGRKTMGLFLGIAFQLLARPGDRLSHVLVRPAELEGHPDFFYPPASPASYQVKGRRISSRVARVELAEIPILLLREKLEAAGLGDLPYSALVAQAQQELDRQMAPPPLILDSRALALRIADRTVPLTPLEFALYRLLARRRMERCKENVCPGCDRCGLQAKDFLDAESLHALVEELDTLPVRDERVRSLAGWQSGGDQRFLQVRSKINAKIRDALGPGRWVEHYFIARQRESGALARYRIGAAPDRIVFR